MVSIDRKTGVIEAGEGWFIKVASHSLDIYKGNDSYTVSCEIVERGLKIVVFNDLPHKGISEDQVAEVLAVLTRGLTGIGLIVEVV